MIKRAFLILVAGVALYLLLPRLGGLQHNIAALRHARLWLMALGVVAEAASLCAYITLYRYVLIAEGQHVRMAAAAQGIMAGFLVSHLIPGGSAAGTIANVRTMEREGVNPRVTAVAVTLTVMVSDVALAVLFLAGVVYSLAKGSLPVAYVITAAVVIPVLAALVGTVFLFAFRRDLAAGLVRSFARMFRHLSKRVDPEAVARTATDIADQARAALRGRRFGIALLLALGNWLLDVGVLYMFFLAVGHHQHFGALLVAYAVANLVSAIPVTPGGLGVMEATLVAISVGFGAPRSDALVAVLGYRLVNFWFPLPFGLVAYIRARLGGKRAVVDQS